MSGRSWCKATNKENLKEREPAAVAMSGRSWIVEHSLGVARPFTNQLRGEGSGDKHGVQPC